MKMKSLFSVVAGLAITAGTYASLGAAAPARVGVSAVKAASKAGHMTTHMSDWLSRSVRDVVDLSALKRVSLSSAVIEPTATANVIRQAVRTEKANDLVRVAGDLGRVGRVVVDRDQAVGRAQGRHQLGRAGRERHDARHHTPCG